MHGLGGLAMKVNEKCIYFESEEEFPNLPMIGIGGQGAVYTCGDTAYKIFSDVVSDTTNQNLNIYEYLQGVKLTDFSFPKKLIFVNNRFSGYTMPLFKGHDLERSPFKNSFSSLKKNMIKAEKSLKSLADYKVKVEDLYTTNIILLDRFKFIDIDLYCYNKSFSRQECIDYNIENLDYLCCDILYAALASEDKNINQLVINLLKHRNLGEGVYLELIDKVYKELNEVSGEEVRTLSQGAKVLQKKSTVY